MKTIKRKYRSINVCLGLLIIFAALGSVGCNNGSSSDENNITSIPIVGYTMGKSGFADGGPRSIVVDYSGALYIADSLNKKVVKLNQNGQFIKSWNSSTDYGEVERLFYRNEKIYVLFPAAVCVLDTDLNLILQFDLPNNSYNYGICVDSDRSIYVLLANSILKYSTSDGVNYSLSTQWGSSGSGPGQFGSGYMNNLVIDSFDNIYVPDGYKRVQKFDKNGDFVLSITNLFQAYSYIGLTIDTGNNILYVLDVFNNQIYSYTLAGSYLKTINSKNKLFYYPSSIYYYNGYLYILDFNNCVPDVSNNRILKLKI